MSSFKISNAVAFLLVISFFGFRSVASPTYLDHRCSDETTFTRKSAYQANLNSLLSSLSADNAPYESGFYNSTAGENPNEVYGLFLCRGDLGGDTCKDCVRFAIIDALQKCPVEKDTVIWYDECLLRYSTNKSMFSSLDISRDKTVYMLEPMNITRRFNHLDETLNSVINATVEEAANDPKKFFTMKFGYTLKTLYILVQCTRDLSSADCSLCLHHAVSQLSIACANQSATVATPHCNNGTGKVPIPCNNRGGKVPPPNCNIQGGRALTPCCNIRFELYPFYSESLVQARPATRLFPPPPPGSVKQPEGTQNLSTLNL